MVFLCLVRQQLSPKRIFFYISSQIGMAKEQICLLLVSKDVIRKCCDRSSNKIDPVSWCTCVLHTIP